jgi:hypothetical protein
VASNGARILNQAATAREAKVPLQVPFRKVSSGKTFGTLRDLNDALLAFALLTAGSRDGDTQRFRVFEQRRAGGDAGLMMIEVQLYAHATPATGAGRHNNRF